MLSLKTDIDVRFTKRSTDLWLLYFIPLYIRAGMHNKVVTLSANVFLILVAAQSYKMCKFGEFPFKGGMHNEDVT